MRKEASVNQAHPGFSHPGVARAHASQNKTPPSNPGAYCVAHQKRLKTSMSGVLHTSPLAHGPAFLTLRSHFSTLFLDMKQCMCIPKMLAPLRVCPCTRSTFFCVYMCFSHLPDEGSRPPSVHQTFYFHVLLEQERELPYAHL